MLLCLSAIAAGCGTSPTAAPVIDRSPNAAPPAAVAKKEAPKPYVSPAPAAPAVAPAKTAEPAPVPVRSAEPGPEVRAAPGSETVVAQKIEDPPAKPYRDGDWRPEYHVVKKGDTLYSIALDYGQDYRELAAWNSLEDPGLIRIDQRLRLFPPEGTGESAQASLPPVDAAPIAPAVPVKTEPKGRKLPYSEQALAQLKMPSSRPAGSTLPPASVAPAPKPAVVPPPAATRESIADGKLTWEWPAHGKISYGFGQGSNQKGVGIEGKMGEAVMAGAPGKVVYSGSGLRGYGKLVIIKHNASYLSVYAHNSQILVKEGQSVAKGQKIAEMGDSDSNRVGLHFEIRRLGKPTDPLQYLPERAS
jgi:lipoprotein NlpD